MKLEILRNRSTGKWNTRLITEPSGDVLIEHDGLEMQPAIDLVPAMIASKLAECARVGTNTLGDEISAMQSLLEEALKLIRGDERMLAEFLKSAPVLKLEKDSE